MSSVYDPLFTDMITHDTSSLIGQRFMNRGFEPYV